MDEIDPDRVRVDLAGGLFLIVTGIGLEAFLGETRYAGLCVGIGCILIARALATVRSHGEK